MPTLSDKTRDSIYVALASVNAILIVCVQQNVLPASWSQGVAIATAICFAGMKQFGHVDQSAAQ